MRNHICCGFSQHKCTQTLLESTIQISQCLPRRLAVQPARKSACPGAKERRFEPHYDAHYDGGREADLVLWRSEAPDLSGIYTRNSPPIFTDASALQPARKSACSRAKERMFEPQRRPCSRPAPAPRPFAPVRARALTSIGGSWNSSHFSP